jgi:hypothetical protein
MGRLFRFHLGITEETSPMSVCGSGDIGYLASAKRYSTCAQDLALIPIQHKGESLQLLDLAFLLGDR